MAAPVDFSRATSSTITANTTHTIFVNSGAGDPVAGTLLIVLVRFAGAPGTVTFTGFTQLAADTSDASDDDTRIYYRRCTATETAKTLTTSNSIKLAGICWQVTGAEDPATIAPYASAPAIGTAANINPDACTPGSFINSGAVTLGIALFGATGVNNEYIASSFVPSAASITSVTAWLSNSGSPTDDLIVEIQTDSGGNPSGTSVGTVATVSAASLTTTRTLTTWSGLSINVTPAQTYWLVFRRSGARDATNYSSIGCVSGTTTPTVTQTRDNGFWQVTSDREVVFTVVTPPAANDYLFITMLGLDSETATATAPSGYANSQGSSSGTGGAVATNCMIWGASKQATAVTSDDPGAWTSTAPSSGVTAFTIAIPAPVAAPPAPGPVLRHHRRRAASRFLTFR